MKQTLDLSIPRNRIIVALDVATVEEITYWVKLLKDEVGYFKIGFQLIHSVGGPQAIQAVKDAGGRVFYDCKLHDIPETMKLAAIEIAKLGVDIFNVHASAGMEAMKLVQEVSGESMVSAVSVLTSMKSDECVEIYGNIIESKVLRFAASAHAVGIPSIICAPKEAKVVKNILNLKDLVTITPAIRPLWSVPDDQNPERIMTPHKAIMSGADMLVIGRPILKSPSDKGPIIAVALIVEEIIDALNFKNRDNFE